MSTGPLIIVVVEVAGLVLPAVVIWRFEGRITREPPPEG